MYRQTKTYPDGLILASASPRRLELLTQIGAEFTVMPAASEPELPANIPPEKAVKRVALSKAREVYARAPENATVIAADTIVVRDGKIFGKPRDEFDAKQMLTALSGNAHTVYTGVAVIRGDTELCEAEATVVYFRELTEAEIDAYIATGDPLDKAGAYGIQGKAAVFIRRIEGDYYNVVGLPLCKLDRMLLQDCERIRQ